MKVVKFLFLIVFALFFVLPSPAQISQTTETSLSYGLVVDNSNSLRPIMKRLKQACKNIVAGNKADDETFIVRFSSSEKIEQASNFTQDISALNKTIDKFDAELGQTAIIDALYLSAQYLSQKSRISQMNRRKALVLITDGEDRDSYYKMDQVLELLKKEKIAVYVISLSYELKEASGKEAFQKATEFINTVTKETGGNAFLVKKKEQIEETVGGVLDKIRQP